MTDTTKQPSKIIVFPRGQLSELDKARFEEHGILAIEADDPKAVMQLELSEPMRLSSSGLTGDAIVNACLSALAGVAPADGSGFITTGGKACHQFVKSLANALNSEAQ